MFAGASLDVQYSDRTRSTDRSFFKTPAAGSGAVTAAAKPALQSRRISRTTDANYDAVSIILRKRMLHASRLTRITLVENADMSTHSNGGAPTMKNYDIWADYGPANWDVPSVRGQYIYDVTFLRARHSRL